MHGPKAPIHRRSFLQLSAGAAVFAYGSLGLPSLLAAAPDELAKQALDAGEGEVIIAGGTGAYGALVKKHFYDPFTEATGIKVTATGGSYGEKLAKLKAMATVGRVEWDVVTLSADSLAADVAPLLQDLGNCSSLPNLAAQGIDGSCLTHGVLFDIGGGVLAFDKRRFPDGQKQPASWADFWDVKTFPGPRALPNIGTPWWPLMAALQADGVQPNALFPLDLDRGFSKLDAIKPHVSVWWKSGDQSQQIFRNREVEMAMMFSGRSFRLQSEGIPLGIVWKGAPLDASVWAAVKSAQHPKAAAALLNFVYTRPDAHAAFAAESFGSTALRSAIDLLPQEARGASVVAPANWSQVVRVDTGWLTSNRDTVLERWNSWLAS
jgi:mannopine transport system substrate-binding protein